MKNEHTSSTAPLLIGMAAGAALGAAGVMATNTSQRQMRRTARKIAEHAVSQLDKMVGDFVEHKMEG
jgi:gas vesicle protein